MIKTQFRLVAGRVGAGWSTAGRLTAGMVFGMALFLLAGSAPAVTTDQIAQIRGQNLLRDEDMQQVEDFVNERFTQMSVAQKPSAVSSLARQLLENAHSRSGIDETQTIYHQHYRSAVKSSYKQAYERSSQDSPPKLIQQVRLAVAVVLAVSADITLTDDFLVLLTDESPDVRYWAVQGLAAPALLDHLTDPDIDQTQRTTVQQALLGCARQETSVLVLAQLAEFATVPDGPANIELLRTIVTARIAMYHSWIVNNELSDLALIGSILRATSENLLGRDEQAVRQLIVLAAQLYTAAYQRYEKGMTFTDPQGKTLQLLSEPSRQALEALLIEGEQRFLRIEGSGRQGRMLRAFQAQPKRKWSETAAAFNALAGPNGILNRAYTIYDETNSGPAELPDPPQEVVARAANLAGLKGNLIGAR